MGQFWKYFGQNYLKFYISAQSHGRLLFGLRVAESQSDRHPRVLSIWVGEIFLCLISINSQLASLAGGLCHFNLVIFWPNWHPIIYALFVLLGIKVIFYVGPPNEEHLFLITIYYLFFLHQFFTFLYRMRAQAVYDKRKAIGLTNPKSQLNGECWKW